MKKNVSPPSAGQIKDALSKLKDNYPRAIEVAEFEGEIVTSDNKDNEKKGENFSLREIFGIGTEDCKFFSEKNDTYGPVSSNGTSHNLNDMTLALFVKTYNRYPSSVSLETLLLKRTIKTLMKHGDLTEVATKDYHCGSSVSFILKLKLRNNQKQVFITIGDSYKIDEDIYSEYKTDEHLIYNQIYCADDVRLWFFPGTDVKKLCKDLSECAVETNREIPRIEMIISTQQGLKTQSISLDYKDHSTDLELHYGEGFTDFDEKLIARLIEKNKGIVMLHGQPGTGKTHYIRRLLQRLSRSKKRVILIPKYVLSSLESPDFNQFMLSNFVDQKVIFIIEDSESVITKRTDDGGGRSHLVSTILNITDGILNDIFNIQVILTFNTDLSSIDDALLRKGRLMAKYKFESLSRQQAEKLAKVLKVVLPSDKNIFTLADIYALQEEEDNDILIDQNIKSVKKEVIGFGS